MSVPVFDAARLILKVIEKQASAETQQDYKNLFAQMRDMPRDQIDILFKLIALLLNCSNQLVSVPKKFRCVYFLKFATSSGIITDNIKKSLANQKYLLQTLLRFALHNKNKDFPSRGEGLFPPIWPTEDRTIVDMSNNLIGLTLELLKHWAQTQQNNNNIFYDIYRGLLKEHDLIYPDYEVYFHGSDLTEVIDWTNSKGDLKFSDLSQKDENFSPDQRESPGEPELIKKIHSLEESWSKKYNVFIQEFRDSNQKKENANYFHCIVDYLIELQIGINDLKTMFSGCPVLEITKELFELCKRPRSCHQKFERLIFGTFNFLNQSHPNFEDYATSMVSEQAKEEKNASTQTEVVATEKTDPIIISAKANEVKETSTQTEAIATEKNPPTIVALKLNEASTQTEDILTEKTGSTNPILTSNSSSLVSKETDKPVKTTRDEEEKSLAPTCLETKDNITLISLTEEPQKKNSSFLTRIMFYNNKNTAIYSLSGNNEHLQKKNVPEPGLIYTSL